MSASQRRKGQAGEREAYRELHQRLGDVVGQRELGQARDGGFDILVDRDGVDLAVEVKRQQKARVQAWLEQAGSGHDRRLSAVMWRPDRGRWGVAMDLVDFCELVREAL